MIRNSVATIALFSLCIFIASAGCGGRVAPENSSATQSDSAPQGASTAGPRDDSHSTYEASHTPSESDPVQVVRRDSVRDIQLKLIVTGIYGAPQTWDMVIPRGWGNAAAGRCEGAATVRFGPKEAAERCESATGIRGSIGWATDFSSVTVDVTLVFANPRFGPREDTIRAVITNVKR